MGTWRAINDYMSKPPSLLWIVGLIVVLAFTLPIIIWALRMAFVPIDFVMQGWWDYWLK